MVLTTTQVQIQLMVMMKPKNKKLVFGIGVNDADYIVEKRETIEVNGVRKQKVVWKCLYYQTWVNMLKRCYYTKTREKHPTYVGCTVSDDWHTFSVFKEWMEKQDWEDKHLDKDILFEGNRIYSADTCVFVTRMTNVFTTDSGASRGEWMIGVNWNKPAEKFQSNCSNPFTRKREHLGLFTCEQQAHNAWAKRKLELAHKLAAIQTDERVAKALIERYS